MRRHLLLWAVAAIALVGLGERTPLLADEKKITDFTGMRPSADEIKRALTPDETDTNLPKRRGISIGKIPVVRTIPTIALSIEFDFGSASLTPAAVETLEAVATALSDPGFQGVFFQLEGHTDAVGSEGYNLELSNRRAIAVRDHLVGVHGISPTALSALGRGETELLNAANPDSSANRRVEISNLGANPEEVASVVPTTLARKVTGLTRAKAGSGFFINQDGHLLTSHTLVESCAEIRVASVGENWVAAHQSSDPRNNLALLSVPSHATTFVAFREGRGPRRDTDVVIVGIPETGSGADAAIPASGLVSALAGPNEKLELMQITAALPPEYLGGPVVDTSGAVVALTVDAGKMVGLATKASVVRTFLDSLDVAYHTTGQGAANAVASTAKIECWR